MPVKVHLPKLRHTAMHGIIPSLRLTACGRPQAKVDMADEPDEGHATCLTCIAMYRGN